MFCIVFDNDPSGNREVCCATLAEAVEAVKEWWNLEARNFLVEERGEAFVSGLGGEGMDCEAFVDAVEDSETIPYPMLIQGPGGLIYDPTTGT